MWHVKGLEGKSMKKKNTNDSAQRNLCLHIYAGIFSSTGYDLHNQLNSNERSAGIFFIDNHKKTIFCLWVVNVLGNRVNMVCQDGVCETLGGGGLRVFFPHQREIIAVVVVEDDDYHQQTIIINLIGLLVECCNVKLLYRKVENRERMLMWLSKER